jgi:hypothetical protein
VTITEVALLDPVGFRIERRTTWNRTEAIDDHARDWAEGLANLHRRMQN